MPKDFSVSQQHRRCIGDHTNWMDNKEGEPLLQNQRVLHLARNAGDIDKKNRAQTFLQLFMLISLIQNTNTLPAPRRENNNADEYSPVDNEQARLDYQKKILPLLQLSQNIPSISPGQRIVKRHTERNDARAYEEPINKGKEQQVLILVKKDFRQEIDDDIYKLALTKGTPQEIASVRRAIKQNHLRDHWAFATEQTNRLIKMFDDYVIYKAALSSLKHSLTKQKLRTLLFEKSSKLYGLAGDSEEVQKQRLVLKVQLYHLDKLAKGKFKLVYQTISLTPNPKNDANNTYESVEAELAAQLIERIIESNGDIPEDHVITYGPAYQARKTFIAYALYAYGIHSQQQLARELSQDPHGLYKQLFDSLEKDMKEKDGTLGDEIANHFYFSLFNTYLANPDVSLAISKDKTKRMGDFSQNDKIDALIYHFNSDIEVRAKVKRNLGELFFMLAQEIILSGRTGKNMLFSKNKFSKGKLRGRSNKPPRVDSNRSNSFAFKKKRRNIKSPSDKVKKPNRKDFSDDAFYLQERQKYEKYLKDQVALSGNTDRERRKKIAIDKMSQLEKVHHQKITQESSTGFTLTTAQGDRGDIVVLSAHAWSDPYTNLLSYARGKKIFFLGPDGKVLLEAPEQQGLLPTSYLVAGKKYPQIFSSFTDKGVKVMVNKEGQPVNVDQVKNYRLKHYEATPDEEVKLAVLENRLKTDNPKMDFLTVDEMAGEKKLSDVLNLMKKNYLLQDYDKVVFYACREIKKPGVMKPKGLTDAYEIVFIDIPLPAQGIQKRSVSDDPVGNRIQFDGYYLYERFEVGKDKVTPYLEGITPYRISNQANLT